MAELDDKLAEAELLHRTMRENARRSGDDAGREVVKLRARFAGLIIEIMEAMKRDPRLAADQDKYHALFTLLSDMRQNHFSHQSAWRGTAIMSDPDGYRRASEALVRDQDEFYVKARALLTGS